jgi:uncharacterized membrane protein YhaH (DUF805 family)
MDFVTSIKVCFRKYAEFNGRASRSEYWWFYLFTILVYFVSLIASSLLQIISTEIYIIGSIGVIGVIFALFLPNLAVSIRRMHDTSKSGAWLLMGLIPCFGLFIVLILLAQPSTSGPNQYGAKPRK